MPDRTWSLRATRSSPCCRARSTRPWRASGTAGCSTSTRSVSRASGTPNAGLLTHLHPCITGLRHPVRVPKIPMSLDAVVASQDLYGGFQPRIGELHLRVIGITSFPVESVPEMLGFLHRLPVEFRWGTRFV